MSATLIISISVAYIGLLFFIAWWTDSRSAKGRSIVNNPYVYALSLGVYCTAWTFYGSVGKAANSGIDFLPVYLGPTIVAIVWWFVLRKIIIISKRQRITSIADFVSSRYGKSTSLGVMVTLIAVLSIIPYISIQLKATAVSFDLLKHEGEQAWTGDQLLNIPFYMDSAWYIAIALAIFTILFGTRNLDPNERHEGLVAAVAFESLLKLVAFLAIGIFVVFGIFNGADDLFSKAATYEEINKILFLDDGHIDGWYWFWLMLISMSAILFLPRQFHISVVENTNPDFVKKAAWVFPLYLFLINLFVIPVAIGGTLTFGMDANADMFVLSLPIHENQNLLALFVALGGFSASTSMVIVAVTALGIMISNHIVMPLLLQYTSLKSTTSSDISEKLLAIRRVSIVMVMIIAYGYFKFVSSKYSLVSIGLISFVGVAQFAPSILGGLFWKRATKKGAVIGLSCGFVIWFFCLPLPTLIETGFISNNLMSEGLFGMEILRPYNLFGIDSMDQISHGAFWSLLINTGVYMMVSLNTRPSPIELAKADIFVNIYKYESGSSEVEPIKRSAKVEDIENIMIRFLGKERAERLLKNYEAENDSDLSNTDLAPENLIRLTETHLAGAIGAASAKIILNSVVKEDQISLEEMFKILDQTKEILQYSRDLELKSNELEATTSQLKIANAQLKELDILKADFITTVTHELRTPITSIKSLAKILVDNPSIDSNQKKKFLNIILSESERIARMVNQVLDHEKIQSLNEKWNFENVDFAEMVRQCCASMEQVMKDQKISFEASLPEKPIIVKGVRDKLMQAILNLLSNAIKFCDPVKGRVEVTLTSDGNKAVMKIKDNGMGIKKSEQDLIFEKFTQLTNRQQGKPKGTGLGLPITRKIIEKHQGQVEVESTGKMGTVFVIRLPHSNSLKVE